MTTSSDRDALVALFAALVKAQAEFPVIPKNSRAEIPTKTGGKYSFRYADLGDVIAGCSPVLKKHGLAVLQFPSHDGQGRSTLTTYIIHESGESLSHDMLLIGEGPDPKTQGTAITYARRYAYCAVLGVVADEDIDAAQGVDRSPAPPPAPVDTDRQNAIEAVYAKVTKVREADIKDGPYIMNIRSEVRRVLGLAPDASVTPTKVRQWIDVEPGEAEAFVDEQLSILSEAADAAE